MFSPDIVITAVLNGLLTGAVYALVALGLTLVYGVLHIINFAHGALLTAAMFAVLVLRLRFGIDPYLAILILTPAFFVLGYALQRLVIGPASHGSDANILLVTLGLSIVIENALLAVFRSDTRSIDVPPRGRVEVPFEVPNGSKTVEAVLGGRDQLSLDNRAELTIPENRSRAVLLVSRSPNAWKAALEALPGVDLATQLPDPLAMRRDEHAELAGRSDLRRRIALHPQLHLLGRHRQAHHC